MISCEKFYQSLLENNISFFTGVPDSLLKNICAYITDHAPSNNHIIAANEGAAVGLAIGYHLATGKIPMVYLQNSGFGNTINPLLSIVDPEVYQIPMVLMIGWRGEPGVKDEPQHKKQGRVNQALLQAMEIPFSILSDDSQQALLSIKEAAHRAVLNRGPYALLIRKGIFEKYQLQKEDKSEYPLSREMAIKIVVDHLDSRDTVISTTGMTSRELFEYREFLNQGHDNDFLTIGGMGHTSQIALGIALQKNDRQIFCLDGDGSVIMHMGSLAVIGTQGIGNYKHIIFNNGVHDSVGGQPTAGFEVDFCGIAKANGYKYTQMAESAEQLHAEMQTLKKVKGPALLEIKVKSGARENLGRPTTTPVENKERFMNFLKN